MMTVDYVGPKGKSCLLCMSDSYKKEEIEKLHPDKILTLTDLTWITKDEHPPA